MPAAEHTAAIMRAVLERLAPGADIPATMRAAQGKLPAEVSLVECKRVALGAFVMADGMRAAWRNKLTATLLAALGAAADVGL